MVLVECPSLNPNKQHSDYRVMWVSQITDDSVVLVPLSSQGYKRESYQKPIKKTQKNNLLKTSWLCLDSGTLYPLDKFGGLPTKWWTTGSLEDESEGCWKELLLWSKQKPWWQILTWKPVRKI